MIPLRGMLFALLFFWASLLVLPQGAMAVPAEETGAPPELTQWESWVLFGNDYALCPPFRGNRQLGTCAMPQWLKLDLDEKGGTFSGVWSVWGKSKVTLPGDAGHWPRNLKGKVDGAAESPLPVAGERLPFAELGPGIWELEGSFEWDFLPETLTVPAGGIVSISLSGSPLEFPQSDLDLANGVQSVWLKPRAQASKDTPESEEAVPRQNTLSAVVNRLVTDGQPMRVLTVVKLSVSGDTREELLPDVLLPGSIPVFLKSGLPARITKEGLRVQARQGVYEVSVLAVAEKEAASLGPVTGIYGTEHWAFQQAPSLRQVEISGAPQVDATQADVPWRNLPIYALGEGMSLDFQTLRRGDPDPGPNQLTLARYCWLDYSGDGLSCQDALNGEMRRDWYLTVDKPPFDLGQVSVGGEPQVITWQLDPKGQKVPGIQLRSGNVRLTADLRLEGFKGLLPASGWGQNLQAAYYDLELPPGYRVLYVKGATAETGELPAAFMDNWTSLDLFVILVVAISAWKLLGKRWGIIGALALVISYHEFMCPRLVYLHLLIAIALLKVLPQKGKASFLTRAWKFLATLALIGFAVSFTIHQARIAIYPQLESNRNHGAGYPLSRAFYQPKLGSHLREFQSMVGSPSMVVYEEDSYPGGSARRNQSLLMDRASPAPPMDKSRSAARGDRAPKPVLNSMVTQATEAKAQNTFARPKWHWRSVLIGLNGQATKDQMIEISLIPPKAHTVLCFLRIILLCLFSLALISYGRDWCKGGALSGFFPLTPEPRGAPSPTDGPPPESGSDPSPSPEGDPGPSPEGDPGPGRGAGPAPLPGILLALALGLAFLAQGFPALAQPPDRAAPQPAPPVRAPGGVTAPGSPFPPDKLLDEFRMRLLKEEEGLPPSVSGLEVSIDKDLNITLRFQVEAHKPGFVPLPQLDNTLFRPSFATLSTGESLPIHTARIGTDAVLWVYVPGGISDLSYGGRLRRTDSFQINFPDSPRPKRVTNLAEGWGVEGLDRDRALTGNSLFFSREAQAGGVVPEAGAGGAAGEGQGESQGQAQGDGQEGGGGAAGPAGDESADLGGENILSPWFEVERWVSLGLELKVITTVKPIGRPGTLTLDLIKGERPTTPGMNARDGKIVLNFTPTTKSLSWESTLSLEDGAVELVAGDGPYSESWVLDAATLWAVRISGLDPIHSVSPNGYYNPRWEPWPRESVRLEVTRPVPVPGGYLVADRGQLSIRVGKENRQLTLDLSIRTSQGGNHSFALPLGSEITDLSLDGKSLPFRPAEPGSGKGPLVNVPLSPGEHELEVKWLDPTPVSLLTKAPQLDLGLSAANIEIRMHTLPDRWTLLVGGPRLGPAVLFWSFAAALLVFSFLLGRIRLTPLRTLSWFLFFLGLSQLSFVSSLIVAGWLLALGLRGKAKPIAGRKLFNFTQLMLCVWTALALYLIYRGLTHGLLESPQMYVEGNESSDHNLQWFQDRTQGPLAQPWVISVGNRLYQYLMLAWALWMAINIIRWLRWGWRCFSSGILWREKPPKASPRPQEPVPVEGHAPGQAPPPGQLDAGNDPGQDPGQEAGQEAGTDPGKEAGTDPGKDPGDNG
ncbi:MAG: hypothetical protein LBF40_06750 [Deltaproteobacteria bacterium]|jgi:hypothetical protein|nr:hypothetical protein [Deltaproteobacteria bacterium]